MGIESSRITEDAQSQEQLSMLLWQVRWWHPLHETPIKFEMFPFLPTEGSKILFLHWWIEHSGTMRAEIGIVW